MIKDIVGKNVEVCVKFASFIGDAGSIPKTYRGKIISVDEKFCELDLTAYRIDGASFLMRSKTEITGTIYLNIDSIISILVL